MCGDHEQQVLQKYSSLGLRKNQLDRAAKKDHLAGLKLSPTDRDKILAELYGYQDTELHISEHTADAPRYFVEVIRNDDGTVSIKPTVHELASVSA